ncbi:MAG: hypothetical protein ACRED0_12465, partial [Gammaproteobacteria bacterium]
RGDLHRGADRGMIRQTTLQHLEARHWKHILGARLRRQKEVSDAFGSVLKTPAMNLARLRNEPRAHSAPYGYSSNRRRATESVEVFLGSSGVRSCIVPRNRA